MTSKRGIHRLYAEDPPTADRQIWGRKVDPVSRRGFLRGSGLAAMSAAVGASIPFANQMPAGMIPAALAQSDEPFELPGKSGLIVLNDRPINAETPAHLLDDRITPASRLLVRNNGIPPVRTTYPDQWTLEITGESCIDARKRRLLNSRRISSITRCNCRSNAAAMAAPCFSRRRAAISGRPAQ